MSVPRTNRPLSDSYPGHMISTPSYSLACKIRHILQCGSAVFWSFHTEFMPAVYCCSGAGLKGGSISLARHVDYEYWSFLWSLSRATFSPDAPCPTELRPLGMALRDITGRHCLWETLLCFVLLRVLFCLCLLPVLNLFSHRHCGIGKTTKNEQVKTRIACHDVREETENETKQIVLQKYIVHLAAKYTPPPFFSSWPPSCFDDRMESLPTPEFCRFR